MASSDLFTTDLAASRLSTEPPQPQSLDVYVDYPHKISDFGYTVVASLLSFTWFMGTILNIICLVVFLSTKKLRSPTNMFVMALNFCDLSMSSVTFLSMTSSWNKQWLYGHNGCVVEGFLVYFLGLASMYILCAISLDRYVVIAKPLLGSKITPGVAALSIGFCFIGGFLWSAFPLMGWNEYVLEGAGVSCSVVWESANATYTSYVFAIFVFCFILPLFLIAYSYHGVFLTIKTMTRNQTWDKNSRIGKRNLKVEKKMAKTIAIMVVGFLGCWMPYAIVSFSVVFGGQDVISPELATYPAIIAKSQCFWNPMIYVASNQQFRQAFYALLPCSGLREALEKGEEEKPDSDDEDEGDEDKGKTKKEQKKGGGGGGNKVAPVDEEGKTDIEYLEGNAKGANPKPAGKTEVVELKEQAAGTSNAN